MSKHIKDAAFDGFLIFIAIVLVGLAVLSGSLAWDAFQDWQSTQVQVNQMESTK